MLTVVVPAQSRRLMSPSMAMTRLGNPAGQTSYVTELVDEASAAIAAAMDRIPWRQTYRETFGGKGRPKVLLSAPPIESVALVSRNGSTLPVNDYLIEDRDAGTIYSETLWTWTALLAGVAGDPVPGSERPEYEALYIGGWLCPEVVSTWSASAALSLGSWVRPATQGVSPLLFQVVDAGTTGSTEPPWTLEASDSVTDGGVEYLSFAARELPADLRDACWQEVRERHAQSQRDPTIRSIGLEGFSRSFDVAGTGGEGGTLVSLAAEKIVARYRRYY